MQRFQDGSVGIAISLQDEHREIFRGHSLGVRRSGREVPRLELHRDIPPLPHTAS